MTHEFSKNLGESGREQTIHDVSVVSSQNVTFNQTQIIQISVEEVKTRKFIITSPYKGLKKFESEDKDRFFGRDQFLTGLVNELEQTNFVLLLGASGSGKSSVIRAGLIPWLAERQGSPFVNLVFTPDQDPFESLYASLLGKYKQSEAQIARIAKEDTLTQLVRLLKQADDYWFILIDQFEELFTTTESSKRDVFIKSLVQLVKALNKAGDRSVKLVATMRADFLDRLSPYPDLIKITDKHRPMIAEMQLDELRLAIEQPAAHHGVVFETGLVKQIIDDVQGQAGYLPLLQYTLNLLWETEVQNQGIEDRTLNISNYRKLGGVRGALQQHVEQIYQSLSESEKLAAQRIFLKLVGIGEDEESGTEWKPVRRRATRSEFSDSLEQTVLTQLVNQNLLVSNRVTDSQESTIEIAHEALLTSWVTLNTWIKENRQAISLRNRLNDDVEQWKKTKSHEDLWLGSRLEQALELRKDETFNQILGGLSQEANQFLDASQGERDRIQKEKVRLQRRAIQWLSGGLAVAVLFALAAGWQWKRADRQTQLANVRAEAAEAIDQLNVNPTNGLAKAIHAIGLALSKFSGEAVFSTAQTSLVKTIESSREKAIFRGHENGVDALAISQDGKFIVSGSSDKTVQIWNLQGHPLAPPFKSTGRVRALAISPDNTKIASVGDDKIVQIWNLQGDKLTSLNIEENVFAISFSQDSQAIFVASRLDGYGDRDASIRVWDLQGNLTKQVKLEQSNFHPYGVTTGAFCLNGQMLAIGISNQTIGLWNFDGKLITPLFKNTEGTTETDVVAFSPDCQRLATGGSGKTIQLWNQQGKLLTPPLKHEAFVTAAAFSPDGSRLASGSIDGTIRLWDMEGQLVEPIFKGYTSTVTSIVFSPDGKTIIGSGGSEYVNSDFPDSVLTSDNTIRLWDVESGLNPLVIQHPQGVEAIAISSDGKTIASASSRDNATVHTIQLWDREGKPIGSPFEQHKSMITSVAFSSKAQIILSADASGTIFLWDFQGNVIANMKHGDFVAAAAFSPDGNMVVSGSLNQTLQLWDLKGNPIGQPLQHGSGVRSVAFSPNGKLIVSGDSDGKLRLWNLEGKPLGQPFIGHQKKIIRSVAFSPNGKLIVSGSDDRTVRLWDLEGNSLGKPIPHIAAVNTVAFNPDGTTIASGTGGIFVGAETTVQLWDLQGNPVSQPFHHNGAVKSLVFSPDGKQIISGSTDKTVRFWIGNWQGWLDIACNRLRYHSALNDPETLAQDEIARGARETCQKYSPDWQTK
ncbi:PD40 domain-containing protein [Microcystis aeruginosa CS-558/01A06]|uniref:PD40 domain-containing protein n=1 Tax=Microcystis aeruginosa BLCC-F108 TaxID=2755317 RepID=A0A841UVX9_MICAE|nr:MULTISPECIES: PD40 domain-containing protein [Microcystis]MBC1193059.1 PD40 domain-containing protein [Microcystis aeruginosa BLCC-F108]MCA2592309.1 PD40 domain-containing protein [Microcystis sp. M31BS1]MDB9408190.1 PD40 domain-containing protein [Microcystis aeruginosa CS-558/01A06]